MREGDETQRNGRVGSFVFSIGPTRNQAFITAIGVAEKIRNNDSSYCLELSSEEINQLSLFDCSLAEGEKIEFNLTYEQLKYKYIQLYKSRNNRAKDISLRELRSNKELLKSWINSLYLHDINKENLLDIICRKANRDALENLIDIMKITF